MQQGTGTDELSQPDLTRVIDCSSDVAPGKTSRLQVACFSDPRCRHAACVVDISEIQITKSPPLLNFVVYVRCGCRLWIHGGATFTAIHADH